MHLLDPVTHERRVIEVQIGSQRVRQVHAHLLGGLSLLHHVYLTSYARDYLMHLVDPVTHERGVIEVQIGSQGVRKVHEHLLSGFSLLHHVYLTSYARH